MLLNFNCVFPSGNFRHNDMEERDFLNHLNKVHYNEMLDISKKENISIKAVEMITISHSKVFINSSQS